MRTFLTIIAVLLLGACSQQSRSRTQDTIEPVRINDPLHFSLRALDGTVWSEDKLRGKITLLTFWASWCSQCHQELKLFDILLQEYAPHGLRILAVAIDDDPTSVAAFAHSNNLSLPFAHDREGVLKRLMGVSSLPSTYLLDREGRRQELLDPRDHKVSQVVEGPRDWRVPEFRLFLVQRLLGKLE